MNKSSFIVIVSLFTCTNLLASPLTCPEKIIVKSKSNIIDPATKKTLSSFKVIGWPKIDEDKTKTVSLDAKSFESALKAAPNSSLAGNLKNLVAKYEFRNKMVKGNMTPLTPVLDLIFSCSYDAGGTNIVTIGKTITKDRHQYPDIKDKNFYCKIENYSPLKKLLTVGCDKSETNTGGVSPAQFILMTDKNQTVRMVGFYNGICQLTDLSSTIPTSSFCGLARQDSRVK